MRISFYRGIIPLHFRPPLADSHLKSCLSLTIMQYVIKNLNDRELGRANDARSAWALVEMEWSDAVAVSLDGTRAKGWMMLATLLERTGEAVIICYHRQIGDVTIEQE